MTNRRRHFVAADESDREPTRRSKQSLHPDEVPSVVIAGAVSLLVILAAVGMYFLDQVAVWPMGIGAALVTIGVLGGVRGAVGTGVLFLAASGVVLSRDAATFEALGTNSVMVALCMCVLVGSDLSFTLRRGSAVDPETVQGFSSSYVGASCLGIAAAVLVVAAVSSVNWPSALIVVPLAGLTIAAFFAMRTVRRYRSSVQAADAPVVGRGPARVTADTSWRQFKWQPNGDEQ